MNYLELCREVRLRTGVAGSGPVSVTGQTGIMEKIVAWVAEAYTDVQAEHARYKFLWNRSTPSTIPGQRVYSLAELSAPGLNFIADMRAQGASDPMLFVEWDVWLTKYDNNTEAGTPRAYTVAPNNTVIMYPTPTEVATLSLTYYRRPVPFETATSVPLFDAHQYAIVWRAVMYFAADQEDNLLYNRAEANYLEKLHALNREYLPKTKTL
jgi:hypothetical protein